MFLYWSKKAGSSKAMSIAERLMRTMMLKLTSKVGSHPCGGSGRECKPALPRGHFILLDICQETSASEDVHVSNVFQHRRVIAVDNSNSERPLSGDGQIGSMHEPGIMRRQWPGQGTELRMS